MRAAEDHVADERLSRRRFAAASLAGVAVPLAGTARGQEHAVPGTPGGPLADYVHAADPATRFEPLSAGVGHGGRWRTGVLTSQRWRGSAWRHELSLFMPDRCAACGRMLLWIDGGHADAVPESGGISPPDTVGPLADACHGAGLPGAVVRQVPWQPMFDGLVEDGLIAHSFAEYVRTGDATWPLLLPMVKAAVEAMTASARVAREAWGVEIDGFVVTGASKRGWTTWLSAAVDRRVLGIVPMVIDMLSLERQIALQRESFGTLSAELDDYTSRGIERLIGSPRGRDLVRIVDPFDYRDAIVQPKLIALGTNDPYWPLGALDVYHGALAGPCWVSYAPNTGHDLPAARVCGLVAAMGRHVTGSEPLPRLVWRSVEETADVLVECDAAPEHVTLWQASSPTMDFRSATWSPRRLDHRGAGWTIPGMRPPAGFAAAFAEFAFSRDPFPLLLTTGIRLVRAG